MRTEALDGFPAFVDAVHARLELGRQTYGDRSFGRPPAELLAELEQEALDLAGWGFVLWHRIGASRRRVLDTEAAAGGSAPPTDASGVDTAVCVRGTPASCATTAASCACSDATTDGFVAAVRRRLAAEPVELAEGLRRAAVDLAAYVLRVGGSRDGAALGDASTTAVSAGDAGTSTAAVLDVSPGVAVLPMVRDGIEAHAAAPVALTRVPCAGELVRLAAGDFVVRGVRHTPGAVTVAEVWLEPVLTEAE